MRAKRLPFCVILPLFSVCVWIFLVALPVTFGYLHLRYLAHGSPSVFLHANQFSIHLPVSSFLSFSLNAVGARWGQGLTTLNLPAFPIELLLSIKTWPMTWEPSGLTFWAWRALTFPLFALPAWYYVGHGIDGLLGRIMLHMRDAIFGSLLAAGCAILGSGLAFGLPASDRDASLKWFCTGFLLWSLLFGIVALAAVRQGRPRTATFVRILSGLILGILILWVWTNSRLPLWEMKSPDGSYLIGWRSGIIIFFVAVSTQLIAWLIFRKLLNRRSDMSDRDNPA